MNDITITDGNFTSPEFYMERLNGAGIRVSATGDLTMTACTVILNATGGGIENLGRLTMHSCVLSHNSTYWPYGAAISNIRALGNDPAAVVADQPGAIAARHREQRQGLRVLAHLGAGMPQHGQVAGAPALGGSYHVGIVKAFHSPIIAAGGAR